jgi:lipopolysaccharide cholinephosphotransferase
MKLTFLRGVRNLSCFDALVNVNKEYHGIRKIIFAVGNRTGIQNRICTNKWLKRIDRTLQQYPYESSRLIGNTMGGHWFDEVYSKDYYKETVMLPFEDTMVPAPSGYHEVMTCMYGDYMKLPDENDRNWHGTTIIFKSDQEKGCV